MIQITDLIMNVFSSVILAVQMLAALGIVGLILMQHGKGADMGASFGSGSSGVACLVHPAVPTSCHAPQRLWPTVFFVATLALAYMSSIRPASSGSVLEGAPVTAPAPASSAPATGADVSVPSATPAAGAEGAAQIPTK